MPVVINADADRRQAIKKRGAESDILRGSEAYGKLECAPHLL